MTEIPPAPVGVEFRDGFRMVPAYLASLMSAIETHTLTYEQAVAQVNRKLEGDFLMAAQEHVLRQHFEEQQ